MNYKFFRPLLIYTALLFTLDGCKKDGLTPHEGTQK